MVRYVIEDGEHIEIVYGSDHATGLYLSVYDRRMAWCNGAPKEVNAVILKIVCQDGGGGYFNLHTGIDGLGERVSESTMATFLHRYGVPKERIDELLSNHNRRLGKTEGKLGKSKVPAPPSSSTAVAASACTHCGQSASRRCAKCHKNNGQEVYYCSKKCQQADWSFSHKHFCSLTIPEKNNEGGRKSVLAVLLPENDSKPAFIEIPLEKVKDEEGWFWNVDASAIFGDAFKGRSYKLWNTKEDRPLSDLLQFVYRGEFLTDGSQPNKCVHKMLNGAVPHPWKGPILVLKDKGLEMRPDYLDMQLTDAGDIIDFFQTTAPNQYH